MAVRSVAKSLLDRLRAAPHRFDPFEALRHLDQFQRGAGRPHIRGTITNRHVAAPLAGMSQERGGDGAIDVAFVALAGPLGPLPPLKIHCAQLVEGALRSALAPETAAKESKTVAPTLLQQFQAAGEQPKKIVLE